MTEKMKTTAPLSSVGADGAQPQLKNHSEIIANETAQINLQAAQNPEKSGNGGLQTVSMTELYDTVYPPRTPIVDGFLYGGTYLFVGAPKVGKSFFMGQLAYHVAMGLPLWDYPIRKGTVLDVYKRQTLLIYVCRYWILHGVFGQIDAEVMGHANTYLLLVTASIPFIALYNGGAAIFRTMGNSKISMRVSIVMNIINVTGNAILIYGVHMGTAGVATPTLVSRIVAAVLIMRCV